MNVQDFHDAVRGIREATPFDPQTIHGRKAAVFDLLLDSGARFDRAEGSVSRFYGIDVIHNEAMPANTVEFHSSDGRVLRRLIQSQGKWYEVATDPIEMFPTSR